jgi:anti-sigma-K factor RskA
VARTHDELKELIAPLALGALPAEDVREVRAHIMSCDECLAEADGYAGVVEGLALAVEPAEMPPGFADRVVAVAHGGDLSGSVVAELNTPAKRRRWVAVEAFAFAALLVVIGFLAFTTIQALNQRSAFKQVVEGVMRTNAGFALQSHAEGRARVVPTPNGALFVAEDLPALPDAKTYQLWLLKSCTGAKCAPVSAGTFTARDGVALLRVPRSLTGFSGAAVTVEPAGGSEQPTLPPTLASTSA